MGRARWAAGLMPLLLTGCLTIIKGTTKDLEITSDPSGARVSARGVDLGVTPLKAPLRRGQIHDVVLDLEGYHSASFRVTPEANAFEGLIDQFFLFPFVGIWVDMASGALYYHSPPLVHLKLEPKAPAKREEPR